MAASKFQEIARILGDRIDSMVPGDRIPSEVELAGEFGVSRMTIRRALQVLITSGRLEGRPGSGTFVRTPQVSKRLSSMSFTEAMEAEGKVVSSRLVSAAVAPGSQADLRALELPADAMVYTIERVRLADDVPICVERASLPADRFPGLLGEDLTASLYTTLRRQHGTDVRWTEYEVRAALADHRVAQLLTIADDDPCLETRTVSRDAQERPIESTLSIYRGDLYTLSFRP